MILGFRTQNPRTKEPTYFLQKILDGSKKHSLRAGSRWKAGRSIQMATGVRTKNYRQFNKDRKDLQTCTGTQKLRLVITKSFWDTEIYIDGRRLSNREMEIFSANDGFENLIALWNWFSSEKNLPDQIIHWTDLRY
jgi:hypothetical protein